MKTISIVLNFIAIAWTLMIMYGFSIAIDGEIAGNKHANLEAGDYYIAFILITLFTNLYMQIVNNDK